MISFVRKTIASVKEAGFTASFFDFFQGRATAFAIIFTVFGLWLAVHNKLDSNYALFVTSIQSLVFAHSCKEDWHEQRMAAIKNSVDSLE